MQSIYIRVIFEEHITWKNHIHDICVKVNAAQSVLKGISTKGQWDSREGQSELSEAVTLFLPGVIIH